MNFAKFRKDQDFLIGMLCICQLLVPEIDEKKRHQKGQQAPIFMAEPMRASNSFVGTEEYIAPVSILYWSFCHGIFRRLMAVDELVRLIKLWMLLNIILKCRYTTLRSSWTLE